MGTWYRARPWFGSIRKFESIKETEHTLTVVIDDDGELRERRFNKVTGDWQFFTDWQDAHAHILLYAEIGVKSAEQELQKAKVKLARVQAMQEEG